MNPQRGFLAIVCIVSCWTIQIWGQPGEPTSAEPNSYGSLSLDNNGLQESPSLPSTGAGTVPGVDTTDSTAPSSYLGGPCSTDDECRVLEASCLPFPEFTSGQSGTVVNYSFSKYLINAGLPPPSSYVCRCVAPRSARFSISERRWVCRSPEEIANAERAFAVQTAFVQRNH